MSDHWDNLKQIFHAAVALPPFFTDGLVGSWQPGSLNEAYSDIFGETVDLLNGHGLDSPGGRRQDDA